jgi:hypothetical protein
MAMERLILTGSILSLSVGNNSTSAGKYRKKRVNAHQSSTMPVLGAELRLVPGHRVATADLHNQFVGLRAGRVERGWPVAARVAIARPAALVPTGVAPQSTRSQTRATLKRFNWKVEAGAEFAVTQPVFDAAQLESFARRISDRPHAPREREVQGACRGRGHRDRARDIRC